MRNRMARQDDEAIDRLIGRAIAYADGNRRRAGHMLIDAFTAMFRGADDADRIWAAEVLANKADDVYPYEPVH
jgi:hypothetical protein